MNRDDYAVPSAQTLDDSRLPPASYERAAQHLANARQIAEARGWLREQQAVVNAQLAARVSPPVLYGTAAPVPYLQRDVPIEDTRAVLADLFAEFDSCAHRRYAIAKKKENTR